MVPQPLVHVLGHVEAAQQAGSSVVTGARPQRLDQEDLDEPGQYVLAPRAVLDRLLAENVEHAPAGTRQTGRCRSVCTLERTEELTFRFPRSMPLRVLLTKQMERYRNPGARCRRRKRLRI